MYHLSTVYQADLCNMPHPPLGPWHMMLISAGYEPRGDRGDALRGYAPVAPELRALVAVHIVCWGTNYTLSRFRTLYPSHHLSRSGAARWAKHLPNTLADKPEMVRTVVREFDAQHAQELPLKYVFEIRQNVVMTRNSMKKKIGKSDIPHAVNLVIKKYGLEEVYGHCVSDDAYIMRLFHATSKINLEKSYEVNKMLFQEFREGFVDIL